VKRKSRSGAMPNPGWFRKGQSGNSNGRPTASRPPQASALDVIVGKTLTVAHGCGTREITVEEALQQRTYRDAVAGKRMAQREVLKWIAKREAWLVKHGSKASPAPGRNRAAQVRQVGSFARRNSLLYRLLSEEMCNATCAHTKV
jgi:uncharacterized protein DUF5681